MDADLLGVSTHGIKNLAGYVRAVQRGAVKARPEVRVTGGGAAVKQMSGDGGLGHVVSHHGMEQAIALAREFGVGCVFMRESNHYGASGYWARLAVREQMAGFAMTNAWASIPPWAAPSRWWATTRRRGRCRRVSRAQARPTPPARGRGGLPSVFLDMALSVVAGNRLDIHHRRGQPIPLGWALDKDGQPTTDARARQQGGTYAPIADYKGFGMALVLSLFITLLSDGTFDFDQTRSGRRARWTLPLVHGHRRGARLVPVERFTARAQEISAPRTRLAPQGQGVEPAVRAGRHRARAGGAPGADGYRVRALRSR